MTTTRGSRREQTQAAREQEDEARRDWERREGVNDDGSKSAKVKPAVPPVGGSDSIPQFLITGYNSVEPKFKSVLNKFPDGEYIVKITSGEFVRYGDDENRKFGVRVMGEIARGQFAGYAFEVFSSLPSKFDTDQDRDQLAYLRGQMEVIGFNSQNLADLTAFLKNELTDANVNPVCMRVGLFAAWKEITNRKGEKQNIREMFFYDIDE